MRRPHPMNDLVFPDRLPSPRRSLRTKTIAAVMVLVAVPTLLTGYLTHRYAASAVERALGRDTETLARMTGRLVEGWMIDEGMSGDLINRSLDHLMRDDRIAFLVITDRRGRVLGHRYTEPLAWHEYQRQMTPRERHTPLTLNRSVQLQNADDSVLMVRRQGIRTRPSDPRNTANEEDDGNRNESGSAIAGYLEIGLHDPRQVQTLARLRDTTILMVATICLLCLPLAAWWAHGWVRPLRRMLRATCRLGLGVGFEPIDIRRNDEIGLLANAFNAMAANLSTIQRALIDANEQLERKVADRTRRLEQANHQLQREIEEKDQFLRAVSHDLGAPLRNIAGLTSMLMLKHRDAMNEEVIDKLDRISANVNAETELIGDLLELSRIKARPGRRQPVNLDELVRSLADQFSYDLERKGIVLEIETPLPVVRAERNRMRQVFQNLLDNAIKYMPDDAADRRIVVGWRRIGRERAFYVRDTGRGVAPEDREAIFQVFRRARHSNSAGVTGRGVGLACVKTIVACYGGRVWVRNHATGGAAFCFTLAPEHVLGSSRARMKGTANEAVANIS